MATEVRAGRFAAIAGTTGLLVAVLCCVAAGSASASTWTGHQLTGEAAKVGMFGISCPTASLCVAVGGNNTIASSTNPSGSSASWNVVYAGAGAVPTGPDSFFNGRQIRGVSCPTPQLCVAVTFEGGVYASTDPTGSAAAWGVADVDGRGPNTHFYGVSCPTVAFCAAAAGGGTIAVSTNPLGGAGAWTKVQLGESLELRGISCPSPSLCVAVGDEGWVASSTNPTGGIGAWGLAQLPGGIGERDLFGVHCPTAGLCVSGDAIGNLIVSTQPTGGAPSWKKTDGGGSVQITGASCISSSRCVAVDNNGDVLTSTNPIGGPGDWTFENILPYPGVDGGVANHIFGVSCPSTSLCATAVNRGQIYTSGDPFAAPPTPVGKKGRRKRGKGRKRPKRPRTTIAMQPFQVGVQLHPKERVLFRFYARNHAQVRGFVCKLDRQPAKRCRSPKRFRVGLGRHVFRVRAIGWTGLRGPAEVARFRVCRPQPMPFCIGQPG